MMRIALHKFSNDYYILDSRREEYLKIWQVQQFVSPIVADVVQFADLYQ